MQSITDNGMVCIWRTNFQVGLKTIDDINQTHAIKVYNLFLIIYQLYLELVYIKVQYMKLWLLKTYATLIYIYIYLFTLQQQRQPTWTLCYAALSVWFGVHSEMSWTNMAVQHVAAEVVYKCVCIYTLIW